VPSSERGLGNEFCGFRKYLLGGLENAVAQVVEATLTEASLAAPRRLWHLAAIALLGLASGLNLLLASAISVEADGLVRALGFELPEFLSVPLSAVLHAGLALSCAVAVGTLWAIASVWRQPHRASSALAATLAMFAFSWCLVLAPVFVLAYVYPRTETKVGSLFPRPNLSGIDPSVFLPQSGSAIISSVSAACRAVAR
jgi:hypothetical protein